SRASLAARPLAGAARRWTRTPSRCRARPGPPARRGCLGAARRPSAGIVIEHDASPEPCARRRCGSHRSPRRGGCATPCASRQEIVAMAATSLPESTLSDLTARLRSVQDEFVRHYPGELGQRQPVHTVYGGGHLFKGDTGRKLGELAIKAMEQ